MSNPNLIAVAVAEALAEAAMPIEVTEWFPRSKYHFDLFVNALGKTGLTIHNNRDGYLRLVGCFAEMNVYESSVHPMTTIVAEFIKECDPNEIVTILVNARRLLELSYQAHKRGEFYYWHELMIPALVKVIRL